MTLCFSFCLSESETCASNVSLFVRLSVTHLFVCQESFAKMSPEIRQSYQRYLLGDQACSVLADRMQINLGEWE